jgi:hypothetical protein
MAIAARVVGHLSMPALGAAVNVSAECCRATVGNVPQRAALLERQRRAVLVNKSGSKTTHDIRQL